MKRVFLFCFLLLLISPLSAQTQNQRNEQARVEFGKVETEMTQLYKDIESRLKGRSLTRFRASQEAWLKYRDAEAYAAATPHEGGLMAIEVDYITQAEVTRARISILRMWMEQFSF